MSLDPNDAVDAIALGWLRERPGTPVDSIGVVTRLWQAGKFFGDDRTRLLRGADADAATLDLLSTLRRAGSPYRMTTRELAGAALITAGAITQRVARAEKQGLVIRAPRGPGSRQVDVELTQAGHDVVERLVDLVLGRELQLLHHLDHEERDQLARLLRKLLDGLQTQEGDLKPGHVGH
ncbi:MarR family transcriptional regulator [Saxibacter everestensis]|uniref:MarR family transcriptional regulator n=1 Tax=Saxibacter everestensis TaxID=2909229 RepID=A0ABY8QVQ8_9MICO|nr:MarR family transcriptional regulator [Brevibacteriaceae bacterium ZFBP1038]